MTDSQKKDQLLLMRAVCDLSAELPPKSSMQGPPGETRLQRKERILTRQLLLAARALDSLCTTLRCASFLEIPGTCMADFASGGIPGTCMAELGRAAHACRDGCRYYKMGRSTKAFIEDLEEGYLTRLELDGVPGTVEIGRGLPELYPLIAMMGEIFSEPYVWKPDRDLEWRRFAQFRTTLIGIIRLMSSLKREALEQEAKNG